MSEAQRSMVPPPLVALASWAVPGLGYWLIGQRARALTVGITILALFGLGILIAGIRVIDVPGYDDDGKPVYVAGRNGMEYRSGTTGNTWVETDPNANWVMYSHPFAEILNKPWYIGQVLTGPVTLFCSKVSIDLGKPVGTSGEPGAPKSHVRIWDIGQLYTAVAGMLNLLVIIDAAHRATRKEGA